MAVRAGAAYVDVLPDLRGFGRRLSSEMGPALARAEGATKGFSSRVGKSFGGVARAGTLAFGAIAAAGAGLIVSGTNTAMAMEQAQIGFTNLLGSAEKADAFIRDLQAFSAKTPFEFPGLQTAASKFVGAGIEAKSVIPIMTAVGDSIAAVGGDQNQIDQATRALVQMQQKGRVTGEEMLQLTEAGISSWGTLAAQMGVSIPEAQKRVSKGQVEVNTLLDAISGYAGPLGDVKGMMDAQSGSLKGMLSTLKDVVGQGLAQIAGPIVKGLKSALPGITDAITSLMQTAGPALAGFMGELFKVLGSMLPALAPVLKVLAEVASSAGRALTPVINALAPIIAQLASHLGDVLMALVPLLPPIGELLLAIAPLLPIIAQLVAALVQMLVPALATIIGWIASVVRVVVGLVTNWRQSWEQVKAIALAIWSGIKAAGAAIWNAIKAAVLAVWNALRTAARVYFGVIKAVILTPINAVRTGIAKALDWISSAWSSTWQRMKDLVAGIWDGIRSILREGVNFIIRNVINRVIGGLNRMVNVIDTALGPFINFPDIPKLPELQPLAHGGIATAPTAALIGEGRYHEAVLPLGGRELERVAAAIAGAGAAPRGGALRLIEGRLSFDERGNAYLRGIVAEELEAENGHKAAVGRMRR